MKSNINKHKVLKALDDFRCERKVHGNYSVEEIAEKAKLSVSQAQKALSSLTMTNPPELEYKTGFEKFRYRVTKEGTLAVHAEKHLTEGKEKQKTESLRMIQIGGIIGTIIIGATTLFWNLSKTKDTPTQTVKLSQQAVKSLKGMSQLKPKEPKVPPTKTSQTGSVSAIPTNR